jgi:hypothetical protein
MTPLPKPAVGEAVTDREFGTRIRRITAVSPAEGENAIIKPLYGTLQAWSADESLLLLWHRGKGYELYDGRTYRFLRTVNIVSPTDIEQVLWDPVDPEFLYYPTNYNALPLLIRHHLSTGRNEPYHHFETCPSGDWARTLSLGADPMYLSWGPSPKVVGLMCGDQKFLFDIAGRRVLGQATLPSRQAPQPSPSGRFAYLDGVVYDERLRPARQLALANPWEHASLGRTASGKDTYNAVIFDPPRGGSDETDAGTLVTFDLATGARRVIVGIATGFPYPPGGTHISAVAHRAPGWVGVSIVGHPSGQSVLHNELLLANTDTGTVCRVGHHRSYAGEGRWGYWAEPHAVISPTGTRILFGSDWGNGSAVDTYVVELPAYQAR